MNQLLENGVAQHPQLGVNATDASASGQLGAEIVKVVSGSSADEAGLRDGDVIEVRERSRNMALVLEAIESGERDVPDYLDVDHNKMTATFVRTPALGDVPYAVQMEPNLVVEYYAKN